MNKQVGDFSIKELILQQNRKSFHNVYKLHPQKDEQIQHICQIISKPPFISYLAEEVEKIQKVSCRNVLIYKQFKETQNNYYLFTDLFNEGTLEKICSETYINEDTAKDYLRQILNGLASLHEKSIKGIDLSLKSIYRNNGEVKIGQINLAKDLLDKFENNSDFEKHDLIKEIIAPEILQGKSKGSMASDLFSYLKDIPLMGIQSKNLQKTYRKIRLYIYVILEDFSNNNEISQETISFLKQTLLFESEQRLKWSEVYSHPLLKQLNISNNSNVAVSVLLQSVSMAKMMSPEALSVKPFDTAKNQILYKNLEDNNSNFCTPTPADSVFLNQDQKFEEEDIKMFENQFNLNLQLFKEQKLKAFRRQLTYYLDQRNIYSSLCQSLTYIRLTSDSEYQLKLLEFLIMKAIYLFSKSLKQQVGEITFLAQQIESNLQEQYQILKNHIEKEYDIIQQQFNSILERIIKSTKKQKNQENLEDIMNKDPQQRFFLILKEKVKQFIKNSSNLKINSIDSSFVSEINAHLVFSCIMIVSYLLKWPAEQLLEKGAIEYSDNLRQLKQAQLKAEYERKIIEMDKAFDILFNQK